MKTKEHIYLSTKTTKDTFTINGCGKFEDEKKHLSRTEAMLLYVKLHNWLMEDKQQEIKLEDIFNDEKRQSIKEFIDKQKQQDNE